MAPGPKRASAPNPLACTAMVTVVLMACAEHVPQPKPSHEIEIGGPGRERGRFVTPRGLAVAGNDLWVVDRSGRLQAFDLDGRWRCEVRLAEGVRGFPIGLAGARDGSLVVCDTHQGRLLRFDAQALLAGVIGHPGSAVGEFTHPQRAARDAEGRIYVTEFGNGPSNRVQVFSAEGSPLFAFGRYGLGPGEFSRAMGIVVAGDIVFVTDVSDRIQTFRRDGTFLGQWGRTGNGAGELRYPHGICSVGDTLYVVEHANHRVQRFTLSGEPRGTWGRPGSGPGQLSGPWDVAADASGRLYVADAGNHRVVRIDPAEVAWEAAP